MHVLRASDHKRMPWKNGGGETVEIAVFPPHATVDDFDWRISMATVASDGPFSIFPQIDRTLSILDGKGMSLAIDGAGPVLLTTSSKPLSFAADVPVDATLADGTIIDLNVMTRRGRFSHRVERMIGSFSISPPKQNETVVVLTTGPISISSEAQNVEPERLDAVFLDGPADVEAENIVSYVIRLYAA
ncbi:HutD family protein [Agrobacterium larrymoorei]|uniref:HutD family protein n=1 Tax=Agrobacterium larrymoorei TaxID=160699 RepID=A0A4D7DQ93_9HYPH|nr:HutD family protein [Agrobacterium larrymoorei]QCI96582.1 HutD family protein [Agrobacterium larrymoorei]QYA07996.1 HutD family protein [Agrobacterium larrymoorei]